ncbi:MAG: hypothetical protein IKJ69_04035 [Clostridia bacterium]|nr:hypothetical protein [Clostridia bacterium]
MNENLSYYDFLIGESNKDAAELCFNAANGTSDGGKILFIHGESGCGKTHLLNATLAMFRENHAEDKLAESVTLEKLVEDYLQAVNRSAVPFFVSRCTANKLFLVDDVGFLIGKEATQDELGTLFIRMADSGASVILFSEYGADRFAGFAEMVNDPRFSAAQMEKADAQMRARALDKILADENITITGKTHDYIVNASGKDISALRAYVKQLEFASRVYGTVSDGKAVALSEVFYEKDV